MDAWRAEADAVLVHIGSGRDSGIKCALPVPVRKVKGEQPGAVGAWLHRGGGRDGKNLGGSQP